MREVIDMCNKIKEKKLHFVLNPDDSWGKFDASFKTIVDTDWYEVKFLDDSCSALHNNMDTLPNDNGGIYVFIAKPEIIPCAHQYILYIGRAKLTKSQNLRKRCKEYFGDTRPKVYSMVNSWGNHLFIRYLPLSDNNIIDNLEKELIRTIFPPCNDYYPDKITRMAMKSAFI